MKTLLRIKVHLKKKMLIFVIGNLPKNYLNILAGEKNFKATKGKALP